MVLSSEFGFLYCKVIKENWTSPVFNWMEVIPEAETEENP